MSHTNSEWKKESEAGKLVILWLREECPNRHEPGKKKKQAISPDPLFSPSNTHKQLHTNRKHILIHPARA